MPPPVSHLSIILLLLLLLLNPSVPFLLPLNPSRPTTSSTTSLNTWFFGGTPQPNDSRDECELVAVKIERTSANSRRIGGEITIASPITSVWSILTDYDRLSVHVPNLVESKTVPSPTPPGPGKRRLYQKGAQKIIGFEFGASVTMDMEERFYDSASNERLNVLEMRKILFKCVKSQFFSTFDGEWKLEQLPGPEVMTRVSYVVDVRPKGPVPVGALEWRIREDVPTNLRSVKKASEGVGEVRDVEEGGRQIKDVAVKEEEREEREGRQENGERKGRTGRVKDFVSRFKNPRQELRQVVWAEDETMAAYLEEEGGK
ncbi:hypothetical protein TrVE_jg10548 [Triparma verrucosa]|uniref:Coenzyme Q-binding protein COQ10 START domain-containing protein n=1 Tax=Triparma verrucosa TaxID=1606542 RepID=A0A9W7FMB9_9STRA|nr:hypothetical protein TrVE_jg10548 [Triparma verrucosa]